MDQIPVRHACVSIRIFHFYRSFSLFRHSSNYPSSLVPLSHCRISCFNYFDFGYFLSKPLVAIFRSVKVSGVLLDSVLLCLASHIVDDDDMVDAEDDSRRFSSEEERLEKRDMRNGAEEKEGEGFRREGSECMVNGAGMVYVYVVGGLGRGVGFSLVD